MAYQIDRLIPIGALKRNQPSSVGAIATIRFSRIILSETTMQKPGTNGSTYDALASTVPTNFTFPTRPVTESRPLAANEIGGTVGKIAAQLAAARENVKPPHTSIKTDKKLLF